LGKWEYFCILAFFILLVIPLSADAKTYYIHVLDMPEQWKQHFSDVLPEAKKYWENRIPGTKFVEIFQREKADFVLQWASEYQGTKLGYWTPNSNNDLGKPYIAITLGYMDGPEVKWQDRKFNLIDSEYAKLITVHELGHAIGLDHSGDPNDIMYPSIYDYDDWLKTKYTLNVFEQDGRDFFENIASQTNQLFSLISQDEANSEIDRLKESLFNKQDELYSYSLESPKANTEMSKAWSTFSLAKKYLADAEWTQKEGEQLIVDKRFEDANFKYSYSLKMVNNAWIPLVEVDSYLSTAKQLESGYQEKKVEDEKKTCFLFWCW